MAKPDWGAIKTAYQAGEAARSIAARVGISHTAINNRAKKEGWVRVSTGKFPPETGNQSGTPKKASKGKASSKVSMPSEGESPPDTKRNGRSGNPNPANQFTAHNTAALKHGGYARRLLLSDEVIEDAKALTLDDELFRLRASNLVASENIGRWKTQLEDAEPDEIKGLLEKISAADKAMMRNTVRIESITGTLATVGKIYVDTDYRYAATEKVSLEAERLQLELAHQKKTNGDDKPGGPQIIINLVNSPDGD
ncbi:MAG: hypothetical protein WCD24_21055 [Serratia inhibens]|uniref:hypothetical protein n=1 Tax=Serratia inhibens TaxID=2338073 RepID=UPI003C7E1523